MAGRLCAICGKRQAEITVKIRRSRPNELAGLRTGALVYDVDRLEPWCRPCAEAVLEYSSGETVWCQPGGGYGRWLPAWAIPA